MNENVIVHWDLQQGSDAWLEARKGLCTSSEKGLYAAKKGFETYLIQKEAEIHLQVIEPGATSYDMERGSELEPLARDAFMAKMLLPVEVPGFISRPDLNAGWSPDGLIPLNTEHPKYHGIEIKCRNATNHYRLFKEGLDQETYNQIQFAMAITDIEKFYFVGFNPDFTPKYQLKVIEIPRSEVLSAQTIALLKKVKQTIGR